MFQKYLSGSKISSNIIYILARFTHIILDQKSPFLLPKKGAISLTKKVATDLILSPFWRKIAPSGHPAWAKLESGLKNIFQQIFFISKFSHLVESILSNFYCLCFTNFAVKLECFLHIRDFIIILNQMFGSSQNVHYRKLYKDSSNFLSVYVYVYMCMCMMRLQVSGGRCAKTELSSYGSCETKNKQCYTCILMTKHITTTNYYNRQMHKQ